MPAFTSAAALGVSVTGAIGGGAAITGIASTFGTFGFAAVGFLSQTAIGLALNALAPKPSLGGNRGYQVNTRGGALDHQIIYGKVRVGGAVVFETSVEGQTDNPDIDNQFLYQVIAHAGHEIEGYEDVFINGKKVTEWRLASDRTTVVSGPMAVANGVGLLPWTVCSVNVDGTVIPEVEDPDSCTNRYAINSNDLVLRFYDGTQTAADGAMVADIDKWTSDHKLLDTAYMSALFGFSTDVYPNGVPEITCSIKGKKVYDTRTSTTAWSDNPALCLRDYLTSGYGLGASDAEIDDALVTAAANVCDQTANNGSARFTCNGAFTTGVSPDSNIQNMLTSMGGLLWYGQGKWRMKPAYWVAPTLTLDENDLRSAIAVKTRHSRRDNFNIVKGTFRGPESNWITTDYPQVTNVTVTNTVVSAGSFTVGDVYQIKTLGTTDWNVAAGTTGVTYSVGDNFTAATAGSGTGDVYETINAYLDADGGQESVIDFDLPFTDNSAEARRLARIMLERNRQQFTVSATWGLRAFKAQIGDVVNLNIDRFGWTSKSFEVVSWTFGMTEAKVLEVQMTLREISENVFDEVDDGAALELDNTTLADPFTITTLSNLVVTNDGFIGQDGTFVNSFVVSWDSAKPELISKYILEWKPQGNTTYKSVDLTTQEYEIAPVVSGTTYDIRVKAVNSLGVSGDYLTTTKVGGVDTLAPSAPTNLTAVGGLRKVSLQWAAPTTNTDATTLNDLKFHRVYRSLTSSFSGAIVAADIDSNTYTDEGLSDTTTYYYWVSAIDTSGNESATVGPESATTSFISAADMVANIREDIGAARVDVVSSLPSGTGYNAGDFVFLTSDLKLYEWDGTSWTAVVGEVPSGSITSTEILDGSISTPKLAANSVVADKIATNAITSAKITADSIISGKIATGAVSADKIAVNDLAAIKANLGEVTAGSIDTVSSGVGIRINAPGYLRSVQSLQNSTSVYSLFAINLATGGGATYTKSQGGFTAQFLNEVDGSGAFGSYTTIDAQHTATGGGKARVGVSSNGGGYGVDVYAGGYYDSSGSGYLPFTGCHDGMVHKSEKYDLGDIMVDHRVIITGLTDSFTELKPSSKSNQKASVGVVSRVLDQWHTPASFIDRDASEKERGKSRLDEPRPDKPKSAATVTKIETSKYSQQYDMIIINSVGEGAVNVCGENGDIEAGDLIVTSSVPGKGMKQSDDIVRSMTVAKAREDVTFSSSDEVKQVACIYLCG